MDKRRSQIPRPIDHVHKFNFYKWLGFLIDPDDLESISRIYGVEKEELEAIERGFKENVRVLVQQLRLRFAPEPERRHGLDLTTHTESDIRILAIGDSLTTDREGYVAILSRFWENNPRRTIRETAISSDTSAHVVSRYHLSVAGEQFHWAVLFVGTNDCGLIDVEQRLPRVSLDEYERNIAYLTEKLRDKCGNNIIQVTLPPVDNDRLREFIKPNRIVYDSEYIGSVNAFIRDFARKKGFHLADLASALEGEMTEYLRHDGIHLNGKGQLVLAGLLLEILT